MFVSFCTGNIVFAVDIGIHSEQGNHPTMEDTHKIIDSKEFRGLTGLDDGSFYEIYDGHRGNNASEYLKKEFHTKIFKSSHFPNDMKKAIIDACIKTDEGFLELAEKNELGDGSTGLIASLIRNKLYIANVGDSRAVLFMKNGEIKHTEDHKPDNPKEKKRIESNGGEVIEYKNVFRVRGNFQNYQPSNPRSYGLAVSRAFGDLHFKKWVSSTPDIYQFKIDDVEFVILASDGLWDVISNQEAVGFVADILKAGKTAQAVSETLVDKARDLEKTKVNDSDDITIIVVVFDQKDKKINNEQ